MITFLATILIIVIALFLAYRSMRDYRQLPQAGVEHGLYLVQNPGAVNPSLFRKIGQLMTSPEVLMSLEVVVKGSDKALVIYGPKQLVAQLPEANLLEIEDYQAGLAPEKTEILELNVRQKAGDYINTANLFADLGLSEDERFGWQMVIQPTDPPQPIWQATVRIFIWSATAQRQAEIRQQITARLTEQTKFEIQSSKLSLSQLLKVYAKRSLIPEELIKFPVNDQELTQIMARL